MTPTSSNNATVNNLDAIRDEATGLWVSRTEVAEIPFTAFASAQASEQVPGRLVVRRIPDAGAPAGPDQASLFAVWRFHTFHATVPEDQMDTVAAAKTHRGHAIIEQGYADLKGSALAHLPSGKFTANAAWLILAVITFTARPCRWDHRQRSTHKSNIRHHPPAHLRPPRPARDVRTAHHHPPANRSAVQLMAGHLQCDPRTTSTRNHLTRRRTPGPTQHHVEYPGRTAIRNTTSPVTATETETTFRPETRHPSVASG